MAGRPLRVFISSTSQDLGRWRVEVAKKVRELGQTPDNMDEWSAEPAASQDVSVKHVHECDIFIGLIGARYGSVPPSAAKSVTEIEFDAAIRARKILLMYLPRDLPAARERAQAIQQVQPEPDELFQRQVAFARRIGAGQQPHEYTYRAYDDESELPSFVEKSLRRVLIGGVEGEIAYNKGTRELENGNYQSALTDLSQAVHLLPEDGDPAFLLALAALRGQLPRFLNHSDIRYVETQLQVASRLSPSRAVYALWLAIKLDYYLRNGFRYPHEEDAQRLLDAAASYPPDPKRFQLMVWLQRDLVAEYLTAFV